MVLRSMLIIVPHNICAQATLELAGACMRADQSVRKRIELENGVTTHPPIQSFIFIIFGVIFVIVIVIPQVSSNEETIDNLDKQLADSKITLSDSENKFDDISRKLVCKNI